jgi:hypothetical protein
MKMTRQTVIDDIGMLRRGESSPAGASPNGSGPAIKNPAGGDVTAKGSQPEIPQARH